jgi:hypothetical protein
VLKVTCSEKLGNCLLGGGGVSSKLFNPPHQVRLNISVEGTSWARTAHKKVSKHQSRRERDTQIVKKAVRSIAVRIL